MVLERMADYKTYTFNPKNLLRNEIKASLILKLKNAKSGYISIDYGY